MRRAAQASRGGRREGAGVAGCCAQQICSECVDLNSTFDRILIRESQPPATRSACYSKQNAQEQLDSRVESSGLECPDYSFVNCDSNSGNASAANPSVKAARLSIPCPAVSCVHGTFSRSSIPAHA